MIRCFAAADYGMLFYINLKVALCWVSERERERKTEREGVCVYTAVNLMACMPLASVSTHSMCNLDACRQFSVLCTSRMRF
jgi:hypothetical protein